MRWLLIYEIRASVQNAVDEKQKTAMFHFQVLKHAKELEGLNPKAFCKDRSCRSPVRGCVLS